ncbi:MAG: LCCL domain-containing protein, partial [Flammeovirgaceae bacterium]
IICSTNDNGSNKSKPYAEIECDTNLKGDAFSEYELFTNLRVICPRNCGSSSSQVFGNGIYTDNSSICKAAIHSGFIKDSEGGTIEIDLEPGQKNYMGSTANNIESMDYPNEWDRSFRVKQYKPSCPIDKIKELLLGDKKSSFLSLNENITEGNSLVEAFKIPVNASNSKDELLKEFYSFIQFKKSLGNKNTQNSPNPSLSFNKSNSSNIISPQPIFANNYNLKKDLVSFEYSYFLKIF